MFVREHLIHGLGKKRLGCLTARDVRIFLNSTGPAAEIAPLSEEETRRLLAAARSDRLFALYTVALRLGLRHGQALRLAWLDVDLGGGLLRVCQTLQRSDGRCIWRRRRRSGLGGRYPSGLRWSRS